MTFQCLYSSFRSHCHCFCVFICCWCHFSFNLWLYTTPGSSENHQITRDFTNSTANILCHIILVQRGIGYRNFKHDQMKIVLGFLSGRDVFVSLPTGYGKSLCYACLPWTFYIIRNGEPSIVLIVTLAA